MKTYTLLYLLICFNFFAFGQKDLSGKYFNRIGNRAIIIEDDSLKLIVPDNRGLQGWTLAEATFKWVDNNFIEINSTSPFVLALKGMVIEESVIPAIANDSLKFSFSFPNYKRHLDVSTYVVGYIINSDFKYSEKNKEFVLCKPNFRFPQTFVISIDNPIYDGELDGSFYGFRRVSIVHTVKKDINHISIDIPAIDDSFFERYYIKGEYARVSRNKIEWKGEVFIRRK